MLLAQYLVNGLEENHVCHGITTQEQRPGPTKKALQSRHHSSVLPRLGSSRIESHKLHRCDRFSYSAPRKQQSTEGASIPILDEEQRLNQRQRCTLSQLRSGHCHIVQDYKHRMLGEPSDICTDRGASPQDARHLFACTTHPTDLSPEDIWQNPVRCIRAFCCLNYGNLD